MGEQSTKTLRGSKMEDVIFTGTQQRKSQGFAQVSLTIDNSDRSLAVDSDEVIITRRLNRNGDSEYKINHASVRLKDINELLMDTGLGRDGYALVGQGRIAEIIQSKSDNAGKFLRKPPEFPNSVTGRMKRCTSWKPAKKTCCGYRIFFQNWNSGWSL